MPNIVDVLNRSLPPEMHGCDEELYPTNRSDSASNGNVSLNVDMFSAKRSCVFGRSICSAEGHGTISMQINLTNPSVYDQCVIGNRDPHLFNVSISANSTGGNATNTCHYLFDVINLATLGVFNLAVNALGNAGVPLRGSFGIPPQNILNPDQFQITRDKNDFVTFCPAPDEPVPIETAIDGSGALNIAVKEVKRSVPKQMACNLAEQALKLTSALAEKYKPTLAVAVQPLDSYWLISERLWGDGRLYVLLKSANPKITRLKPGQQLVVPQINSLLIDPMTVKEGDSITSVERRLNVSMKAKLFERHIVKPNPRSQNLIYPFSSVVNLPTPAIAPAPGASTP